MTQRIETDCIVVMATYRIGALTEEKIAEIAKSNNFDRSFTSERSTCNSPCEAHEEDILEWPHDSDQTVLSENNCWHIISPFIANCAVQPTIQDIHNLKVPGTFYTLTQTICTRNSKLQHTYQTRDKNTENAVNSGCRYQWHCHFLLGQLLQQCPTFISPLWQENCQIIHLNEKSTKLRSGKVTCKQQ